MASRCNPIVLTLAAGLTLAGMTIAAEENPPLSPTRHVRGLKPEMERLLANAAQRSVTVRKLIATLEQSDLIVYVTTSLDIPVRTGTTVFVSRAGGMRFLLISLYMLTYHDEMIANLGHELQHAVEVAAAPDVIDEPTLGALYRRIGFGGGIENRFETSAAVDITRLVRAEVWSARAEAKAGPRAAGGAPQ
jgi:hypothetical protein